MGGKRRSAEAYGRRTSDIQASQQALLDKQWAERAGYSAKAEALLGQSPTYTPSAASAEYQTLMNSLGTQLGSQLSSVASNLNATDYTSAGNQALTRGYQAATDLSNTGAGSMRSIMKKGVGEAEGYAKTGLATGLKDTNTFVDYYRQMAGRQEMPGQRATEAKMGRSYAEGYKALGQQSGGSASGLGAMIDLYSNKSEALSDLGIQAAQYKANQEANLGASLQSAQAIRSNLYNNMAEGTMSRAGALASTEQAATGMQTNAYTSQADALSSYALNRQTSAINQANSVANIYNTGITGQASLQGLGLQQGITEAANEYQYNQVDPYQTSMNYYTSQIASLNPYGTATEMYNSQLDTVNNAWELFRKKGQYAT